MVEILLFLHSFTALWSDSYGEDIAETESEDESSDYDSEDEYDVDFISDDDLEFLAPSPVPNSGGIWQFG